MPQQIRIDGITAAIETTYGTDAVPTIGTNAVRISQRAWSNLVIRQLQDNLRDDAASNSIVPLAPAPPGGRIAELNVFWDARGEAAAYSASVLPEADPLFRACFHSRTDDFSVGLENVEYHLQTDPAQWDSATIYVYAGNLRFEIVGCRGNLLWGIQAGQITPMQFQMVGRVQAVVDSAFAALTYGGGDPQPAVSIGFTYGAWDPDVLAALEFNQNMAVEAIESANTAADAAGDGIYQVLPTSPTPQLQVTALSEALTAFNPYDDVQTRTARALDLTIGATQYERIDLTAGAAVVFGNPDHQEQQGFTGWQFTSRLTGTDPYTIRFD